MPRLLLLLACMLVSGAGFAQISPVGPGGGSGRGRERVNDGSCPLMYFGASTGMNNAVGYFGPQVDVALSDAISAGTGFGLSSWGYKFFGEARFYFDDCNRGWAIGAGLTYNTGLRNTVLEFEETRGGRRDVPVDLLPQTNIMLTAYRFFSLGRSGRNRWHLQLGGSIPTSRNKFTQLDGPPLTGTPTERLKALSPGGLVVGLGLSFGAGRRS